MPYYFTNMQSIFGLTCVSKNSIMFSMYHCFHIVLHCQIHIDYIRLSLLATSIKRILCTLNKGHIGDNVYSAVLSFVGRLTMSSI